MDEEADDGPDLVCSFCGKVPVEIEALVSGDHASICNECIYSCMALLAQDHCDLFEEYVEAARNDTTTVEVTPAD